MALIDEVQIRSAADFFHDNKAIAGFDNSMKCVFTSVRELVENGLDAAEKAVARTKKELKALKKQEKSIPEELVTWSKRRPNIYVNLKILESHQVAELLKVDKLRGLESHLDFLELTVKDNGIGVPFDDIPTLFGRVLTGSNYGARQARGRFGLGVKMVLLNAMATVDLPIRVKSRHFSQKFTSKFKILIDLAKNEPIIVGGKGNKLDVRDPEALNEPGTEVTVTFTGSWRLAKKWVLEYFHELAIITPYAGFEIHTPDQEEPIVYECVIDEMPPYPKLTKIHPWGCDITQLKREIAATHITGTTNMTEFLMHHFQRVSKKKAEQFLSLVNVDPNKNPRDLTSEEIRRIIHDGFLRSKPDEKKVKKEKEKTERKFTFLSPEGVALSPLTAENLEKGLKERVNPDFVAAVTRPASAYAGHPFIVEAALAYGGNLKSGVTIYRYANRIPLLFGAGNDVISRVVHKEVEWKTYKINIDNNPLAIAVSIVSTKIPFPETSKEYIADVDEIRDEITKALQALGRQVRIFLSRVERARRERKRSSQFEKWASITLQNLFAITQEDPTTLPVDLSSEAKKIEKALMTGYPLIIERKHPVSSPISHVGYWLEPSIKKALLKIGIKSAFEFLATPTEELTIIEKFTPHRVEQVKRDTLKIFSQSPDAPGIAQLEWVDSEIEVYLNKKWMRTIYDFIVTPNQTIASIPGINIRLIDFTKQDVIKNLNKNYSFSLSEITWIDQELFNKLKNQEIHTILDLIIAPSSHLLFITELIHILIENEKKKIMETFQDLQIDIHEIEWMDNYIENSLREMGISTISEFLIFSTHELESIDRIALKIIENFKKHLIAQISQERIPQLSQFKWYTSSINKKFTKRKILTQLDFLLYPNSHLARDKDLIPNIIQYIKEQVVQELNSTHPKSLSEMMWIEPNVKNALEEEGIRTIYDFLITDVQKLSKINGLTISKIKRIKKNIGTPFESLISEDALFNEEIMQELRSHDIFSIEDLYFSKTRLLKVLNDPKRKEIKPIYDVLDAHIGTLPGVIPHTKILLSQFGINSVIDFLIWPKNELEQLGISSKEIDSLKETIDIQEILSNKQKGTPLNFLDLDSNTLKKLEKMGINTIEEAYFTPHETLEHHSADLDLISKIRETLNAPITILPSLKKHLEIVDKLLKNGITTIIHFILSPLSSLQEITNVNEAEIVQLRKKIQVDPLSLQREKMKYGTSIPLGIGFDEKELKALEQSGIFTIDECFILTKEQFTPHISWEKISRVKEILESPVMIMENVPVQAIRKLVQRGISTIFQFLYWPNEELAQVTNLDAERIIQFKKELRIKKGIPIDSLSRLDSSVRRILSETDIDTLEEVVIATQEMYELPSDTWKILQNIKAVLNSPVSLIGELYSKSSETIASLVQRGVRSILAFLYWPAEDLAEISGFSKELISSIKLNLNFSIIEEKLNCPLSYIPALRFSFPEVIESLHEAEITTIKQFLQTPGLSIQELTQLSIQEIDQIKDFLNPLEIQEIREHAIPLSTMAASRKEIKLIINRLNRLGVLTYEELIPLEEEAIIEERIDWNILEETKNILELPIHIVPHLAKDYRKSLEKDGIKTIKMLIYWPNQRLASLLKKTDEEIQQLKFQIDLKLIKEVTETPIDLLLPLELIDPLKEADINNLKEFLLCTNKDLAQITQLSTKRLTTLKQNIDLQQIRLILKLPETLDEDINVEDILDKVVSYTIQTIINDGKDELIANIPNEIKPNILQNGKDISQERVRISLNNIERELNASLSVETKGQVSTKVLREIVKEEITHASKIYMEKVSDNLKQILNTNSKKVVEKSFNDLKSGVLKETERPILREVKEAFIEKLTILKDETVKNSVDRVKAEIKSEDTAISEKLQNDIQKMLKDVARTEINSFVKKQFQNKILSTLRDKATKMVAKEFTKKFIQDITKEIVADLEPLMIMQIKENVQNIINEKSRTDIIEKLQNSIDENSIINQVIRNTINNEITIDKLKLEKIKEELTKEIVQKFDTPIRKAVSTSIRSIKSEFITPIKKSKKGKIETEKLNEIAKKSEERIKNELIELVTEISQKDCAKRVVEIIDGSLIQVKQKYLKNVNSIAKKLPNSVYNKILALKKEYIKTSVEETLVDDVSSKKLEYEQNITIMLEKSIEKAKIEEILKEDIKLLLITVYRESLNKEFSITKIRKTIKNVIDEKLEKMTVVQPIINDMIDEMVQDEEIALKKKKGKKAKETKSKKIENFISTKDKKMTTTKKTTGKKMTTKKTTGKKTTTKKTTDKRKTSR